MTGDSRHLSADALDEYLASPVPITYAVPGQPPVRVIFEPHHQRLGIETPWDGVQPPAMDQYLFLASDVAFVEGRNWLRLWVNGQPNLRTGYALLRAIADRITISADASGDAIETSVQAMDELLRGIGRLSEAQESGLFGELLVLEHLIETLSPVSALASWKAIRHEEHDFGLGSGDIEVKTTLAEERHHWVHGKGQLVATLGRPLWLLSVQLTDAGASGRTLPELADSIAVKLVGPHRLAFAAGLARRGLNESGASRLTRRLQPRNVPAVYLVDAGFPVLDDRALERASVSTSRIRDLNYLLDLTGLTPAAGPPSELADLQAWAEDAG